MVNIGFGAPLLLALALPAVYGQSSDLFEKNVRPVLVEHCQACHNEKVKSGGLDLASTDGLKQASANGFLGAAAEPDRSPILVALLYEGRVKMPPAGKLAPEKIAAIRQWVGEGASTPGVQSSTSVRLAKGVITEEDRKFWAFQAIGRPDPPVAPRGDWSAHPIDRFIVSSLRKSGLAPAPPADKPTLLRRATFDLTGLPPTEKEIREFVADNSPDAFAKVVDRLLESPRYGERWARHWLDVMRYADSTGSDEDHRYPHAWRYRDYVIKAFNDDMPYDQFVTEQLAGDILAADPASPVGYRGIVATGFLALGKKALAQKDRVLKRYDVVDDQIDVTSKALLGLTVTCARCHDHKFDPISTKDYYSLAAIFASTLSYRGGETGRPVETPLAPQADFDVFKKQWDSVQELEGKITAIINLDDKSKRERDKQEAMIPQFMLAAYRVYAKGEQPASIASEAKLDEQLLQRWVEYLKSPERPELAKWRQATDETRSQVAAQYQADFKRAAYQYDQDMNWWRTARRSFPAAGKVAGPRPEVRPEDGPFFYSVWIQNGPLHRSREEFISGLLEEKAASVRALLAQVEELERTAPKQEIPMACAVMEGEPADQKIFTRGDHHNPGASVPKAFPAILSSSTPQVVTKSGRLELARWIVSPANPLASRVMVNRIWQGHFGDGIVRTPDNFGRLGERPAHPELLDYLARQFMESNWSIKKMHRMIMLSKTYQMSAEHDESKKSKDPENRLLAHFPKRRLSIEEIRDSILAIGGHLDLTVGGTLDHGVGTDGETSASRISMNPESTDRRSIYTPLRRSNLPTLYTLFDFGDATSPEGKRGSTTVATQALFMMNSGLVKRESGALASKLLLTEKSDSRRLERAYMVTLGRSPKSGEVDAGLTYLQGMRRKWRNIDEQGAWQSFCHVLLSSNEFLYVY